MYAPLMVAPEVHLLQNLGQPLFRLFRVFVVFVPLLVSATSRAQNPADDSMEPTGSTAGLGKRAQQPDELLAAARTLLERGNVTKAEESVRGYLKNHATSADAHYLLGYILFKEAKAKESLAEFTAGAKSRLPSAFDLKVVACDYVLLSDYVDADKWFTRSVSWSPDDAQGWYYLGRTKYKENRFDEAISAFKECLKLEPKNVKAEDNLGLAYQGLGRIDEAKAAYQNAIAWEKDTSIKDPGPFVDFGTLLVDENGADDGIPYLQEAIQIAPQDFRAYRELGKAYLHVNRPQDAASELEKAITLAPQDASLHYMLGQAYRKQGLNEKAKAEFDRYALITGPRASVPARQ